jgi:transcriptional regulator with PAS, ATPase and Fis domain
VKSKGNYKTIPKEELRNRKAKNFLYLLTAKNLLEQLFSIKSPFSVSFIDKDGVVLLVMGDRKNSVFMEGEVIDNSLGSSAVLSALHDKTASEIHAEKHTNDTFSNWSCAAAPIFNKKNELAGVLSLTVKKNDYPYYAIGLVSALAKAIENEVKLKGVLKEVEFSKQYAEVISEGSKDGILVLDANAKVLYINETGASILHVNRDTAIGKQVSEIVDFPPVILEVFKTHKGYVDKEFIIDSPSRGLLHFIKTAVVLRNSDGDFMGVVDFFREIKRVRKFVTEYIGAEARFTFNDIIGKSHEFKEAIRIAKIAARSSSSVLISGETGTGKEMFAQAIHFESNYSKGPFVALNCGAVPRDLAESELFGYEPGAFTDASKNGRPGKFELADGGTLFLDEIEELPPAIQTKLLRVIENKLITRVGGTKSLKVDVRIIAATNKDLQKLIKENSFRRDLYYRLNVIEIKIPPLRNRKEDIPLLIKHFLKNFNAEFRKNIVKIDNSFINRLMEYNFPGNVRELQNIIERAVNIAEGDTLTEKHLPEYVLQYQTDNISFKTIKKELVERVLKEANFNISLASKKLGVSRPTVYKLIKQFNLNKQV